MRSKHNPTCGKNKKEERFILMKRFLSILLAILMLAVMLPVTALAANDYVTVSGINGFKNRQFASFE